MTIQVGPGLTKPENLSETNDLVVRMRRELADFIGACSEADCKKAECRAATHVNQSTRKPGAKGAVHVDKFGAGFAQRAKAARRKPRSTWHLDEMFETLRGEPYLLWRAVDEHGAELDVLVQKRRDKAAAKRFIRRLLRSNPVPRKIVTDRLRSYPAAKADIPELAHAKHVFVKAAALMNNRAENSHQPTRRRERQMCAAFAMRVATQAFLSCFGLIRQHFAWPRHQMNAACHRAALKERLATRHDWTVTGAVGKVIWHDWTVTGAVGKVI
jgi:putative transposase